MKTKKKIKKQNIRLVSHVRPIHYAITLEPDLEAHTFKGEETIKLEIDKKVSAVTLHSKELKIMSAEVLIGKKTISNKKISYDEKAETVTFDFGNIAKGAAKLHLTFEGILKDNMRGFYKSRYEVNGQERFMATTQFEATDARRCIPCFDEPTHKAVFQVNLIVPPDKVAISNTLPTDVREHASGYKIVSFAPTPKMSTYLLAFIVGDFEYLEQKSNRGVTVRIYTIPGKKHQAKFALDCTVRTLEFYENYFDIPYPLNTLDMIAIPDFSSLAMENWGAITFREIGLLVDEENTSSASKEMVAEVIAHELAHQWFGNLVTMEWWTHLWLNEGFASYIPYLAMDHLFPQWNMWEKFATDTLAIALKLDALEHTHPIEIEVHHPNEIGEIFDAVSYSKGATVIRMLAGYLGEKDFRAGLQYYLKKHSYKNASTIHLWEAFEKISGKPVKKMMALWTGIAGYPVVKLDYIKNKYTVTQTRHFASETSRKKSKNKALWPIPLSYVSDRGITTLPLMAKKTTTFRASDALWLKLNASETGMYRTHYSHEILEKLNTSITENRLPSVDRLGVVRDLFSLAESGLVPTTEVLLFAQFYKNETEYIVWVELISGLRYLANLLIDTKSEKLFHAYARDILADGIELVGWEPRTNETHTDALMRTLILGAGSYFGNNAVIQEAHKRFNNRIEEPIHADLRGMVYATVARTGGVKEYEALLLMYRSEKLHEEKNRILSALGQAGDTALLKRTLSFVMTDEVRMQDRNGVFASVLVNPRGRALGWEFIKKHWKEIGEAYGDGNHLLSRLVQALNRNTTRKAYNDIKSFFKKHKAPSAERTILQTLEYIDSNIHWFARDGKKIEKWLKTRTK